MPDGSMGILVTSFEVILEILYELLPASPVFELTPTHIITKEHLKLSGSLLLIIIT